VDGASFPGVVRRKLGCDKQQGGNNRAMCADMESRHSYLIYQGRTVKHRIEYCDVISFVTEVGFPFNFSATSEVKTALRTVPFFVFPGVSSCILVDCNEFVNVLNRILLKLTK
jgi:hypothetical protein